MKRLFYLSIIVFSAALTTSAARAQWVQTNGPYGGWVSCATNLSSDVFVGTRGGIYESTDEGSNWQRKSNGLPADLYVTSLATRGSILFAGTDENGVYRSTDSGASWSSASTGLPNSFSIYSLTSSHEAVFVLNGSYSYVSTNDGNDWQLLDTNLTKFSRPEVALTVDSTTFVAGNWITKTTDNGKTWAVLAIPTMDTAWSIFVLENIGNILFAVDRTNGFMRSTDLGQTWTIDSTQPISPGSIECLTTMGQQLVVGTFNDGIRYSFDSAESWESASLGLPEINFLPCLAANGSELLAGFFGPGIYRSFDSGKTWLACNQGLTETSVNSIGSSDTIVVSTTYSGLFLSPDNGASWQPLENNLRGYQIEAIQLESDSLYAGGGGLSLSTDWGANWASQGGAFNQIYSILKSSSDIFVGTDDLTFTSPDDGMWYTVFDIATFGFAEIGSNVIAGTANGIYIFTNYATTWGPSNEGLPNYYGNVVRGVCAVDSEFFISCTPGGYTGGYRSLGVFCSSDLGKTWNQVKDTLFPQHGYVTCFASISNNLFAGTDSSGIFLTTDNGANWIDENLGLSDSNITSLAVQGNELLAGTATSGVSRRPLAEMIPASSVASGKQIADTISIYPDPASSIVTVSCPNLTGTTEASLVSETGASVWHRTISANDQPFQLDFTGVANGAYRLQLQAGNVNQTSKIILQR